MTPHDFSRRYYQRDRPRIAFAEDNTDQVLSSALLERVQQIVQAAEQGARSPEDLASGLGVGMGCGRCRSCAKSLLVETVARITGSAECAGSPQPAAA